MRTAIIFQIIPAACRIGDKRIETSRFSPMTVDQSSEQCACQVSAGGAAFSISSTKVLRHALVQRFQQGKLMNSMFDGPWLFPAAVSRNKKSRKRIDFLGCTRCSQCLEPVAFDVRQILFAHRAREFAHSLAGCMYPVLFRILRDAESRDAAAMSGVG